MINRIATVLGALGLLAFIVGFFYLDYTTPGFGVDFIKTNWFIFLSP